MEKSSSVVILCVGDSKSNEIEVSGAVTSRSRLGCPWSPIFIEKFNFIIVDKGSQTSMALKKER